MEEEALEVLSGVIEGDETSVEGWYLGGWGLWLLAERVGERGEFETGAEDEDDDEDGSAKLIAKNKDSHKKTTATIHDREKIRITHLRDSRAWLTTCLSLAAQLDYEDDRLRDHAQELVQEIKRLLVERGVGLEGEEDEEDEWEGVDGGSSEEEDEEDGNGDRSREGIEKVTLVKRGESERTRPAKNEDVDMSGT